MRKFKVGDTVRVVSDDVFNGDESGDTGEVIIVDDRGWTNPYLVKLSYDEMWFAEDELEWPTSNDSEDGKQTFETGAQRDTQEGKTRYDLIDPTFLKRVADVMTEGAEHYGEFNWTKGIPSQRYAASLLRHVYAYLSGDRSEDHLGRAAFNLQGLARNEGTNLDDLFDWKNK